MDDSEERGSKEEFLSQPNPEVQQMAQAESSNDAEEIEPEQQQQQQQQQEEQHAFDIHKICEPRHDRDAQQYFSSIPSSESQHYVPSELNALNALVNLDPSAKFSDNVALQEMRFAGDLPVEDEVNKVFMCHICDFKTAYANSLMNHQAVHSDVRPWVCAMCEYAAKRKQDLKKHLHTVHGMMVESPMLKPILPGTAAGGGVTKYAGGEGYKEPFPDNVILKRSAPEPDAYHPPTSSSHQNVPVSAKRIKEEMASMEAMTSPPVNDGKTPETEESTDDNLPVCFPSSVPKVPEFPLGRENVVFQDMQVMPFPLPPNREIEEVALPYGTSNPWASKRRDSGGNRIVSDIPVREWPHFPKHRDNGPHFSPSFSNREKSFGHLHNDRLPRTSKDEVPVNNIRVQKNPIELGNPNETDRSISSSSTVCHSRASQTQSGFMCEYCEIIFLQRAMYVMHVGLHSPDNPWRCGVCKHVFTEKYSFTSHFINQH